MDNLPNLPTSTVTPFSKSFRQVLKADKGDEYEFQVSPGVSETFVPEALEGLGAAVISPGTLDTPETPETPVEAFDTVTFPRPHGLEVGQDVEINGQPVQITAILSETQVTYTVMTPEKYVKRWTDSWLEGIDYKTEVKPRTGRRLFRKVLVGDGKQRTLPRVRGCGHILDLKRQPRHRNCKPCWTAFFRNQPEMSENIAKILVENAFVTEGNRSRHPAEFVFGRKFLTRFHEYCRLVERMEALRLAYQEEQNVGIELAALSDEDTVQSVGGDAEASIEVG